MDDLTPRQLLHVAEAIRQRLIALRAGRYQRVMRWLEQLAGELDRVLSIHRRVGLAINRGWHGAARMTAGSIEAALREVPYHVSEALQASRQCEPSLPTIREILAELKQAQDEFEQVKFDLKARTLSVVTDPIELEDVYLGPFEVVLDLARIGEARHNSSYRVIAVDPHPASSNSSVTHPHVCGDSLCEGDASAAIGAALVNGRVADFYLLVRSVLTNYNPGSPYVSLSEWEGRPCHDCGYVVDSDETYYCELCENDFCSSCISYCHVCDESACLGCLTECPVCGDRTCSSCMTTCGDCGQDLCRNCHDQNKCPCHEEKPDDQSQQVSPQEPAAVAAG